MPISRKMVAGLKARLDPQRLAGENTWHMTN